MYKKKSHSVYLFGGLEPIKQPKFFLSLNSFPKCPRINGLDKSHINKFDLTTSCLINSSFRKPNQISRLSMTHLQASPKQEVVSITYEEIGLFPRSFSRVLDRFLKQVFSDVENLVIQEYRFYRYLFLTTLKCLLILFFVPFLVNFLAKTYVVRPLTEYFWNTKQTEIFLNSYQQKHAFSELKDFEEKFYFESLIYPKTVNQPVTEEQIASSTFGLTSLNSTSLVELDKNRTKSEGNNGVIVKMLPQKIQLKKISVPEGRNFISTPFNNYYIQKNRNTENTNTENTNTEKSTLAVVSPFNVKLKSLSENNKFISIKYSFIPAHSKLKTQKQEYIEKNVLEKNTDNIDGEDSKKSLIKNNMPKNSLFVYQTIEADKNIQQRYQEKTIEIAQRYNDQSVEAITNFFGDIVSLVTLFYLLYVLEIQINITQSFLLEVFFGLDDSKKSLLILLVTDLLVGYHSSNLWELFFELFFNHYGLPESQTGIFLLVATLPVLLDVLFKYLIFRHLNRSSPATVATYHAIIE